MSASNITAELNSTSFDNWKYTEDQYELILFEIFKGFKEFNQGQQEIELDDTLLKHFIAKIRSNYNSKNPFHNFAHAVCVTQMMYYLICELKQELKTEGMFLNEIEYLALLMSALGHDLDHPGLNNLFQIATESDLALKYNDISPLENHHCYTLFYILKQCKDEKGHNFLKQLSKEHYIYLRKIIIACILATDISKQKDVLNEVQSSPKLSTLFMRKSEKEKERITFFKLLMKAADLSVEVRDFQNSSKWVSLLFEEFFKQGDEERKFNLAISPTMDRSTTNIPEAQIGFISNVLLPVYKSLANFIPKLNETCLKRINETLDYYKSLKKE